MFLFPLLSLLLLHCIHVECAKKKVRAPYNIKVYTQAYLRSVRKLSAQDASYVVEGQISYAYRQDALWYTLFDGDDYSVSKDLFKTAILDDGSANGLSIPIDSADGDKFIPLQPYFPTQITNYYLSTSWSISSGPPPSFTGLPDSADTSVDPTSAGIDPPERWLYSCVSIFFCYTNTHTLTHTHLLQPKQPTHQVGRHIP